MEEIKGNVHSIETMGLLDGPGVRVVVFLQGCQLRCAYCHNPDTWDGQTQRLISPTDIVTQILRYKPYIKNGGVTFSGGEPLLQPIFLTECLKKCKENGLHTAIDTAGVGFGEYDEILQFTDLVILDVKATNEKDFKQLTGGDFKRFLFFLNSCIRNNKKLWLRQVIVPGINDKQQDIQKLKNFISSIPNVEKVELLPYKTIGTGKYKQLAIPYKLDGVPEMDEEKCKALEKLLLEQI